MRSHRHGFDEILTPEEYADRPSIDLTVKRANSKGNVDVAVIVDRADEVFEIPSTVSFKDGETEATLTVGCKNLEALKPYQFTIHLDENATNPIRQGGGERSIYLPRQYLPSRDIRHL
uniref:hypothetical protein n=1 Tax=Prevotella sp. TaxID=59823 RepID=UPI004028B513